MEKNKLTTCKVCGAEIAKSAETCPNCGAKIKKKHPVAAAIVGVLMFFVVIGIVASSLGGGSTSGDQPEKTEFGVGETATLNGISVTLAEAKVTKSINMIKAGDGQRFIICKFEVENQSNRDISLSTLLSTEAYCDDYSTSISYMGVGALYLIGENTLDGTVASGKKLSGCAVYEIPKDWKEFEVRVEPDFWSNRDITFIAKNEG